MKILILDVYPDVGYRISKDQNGGYGTANDYGDSLFSKILKFFVKNSIDFPPLYSVQVCGELIAMNHNVFFKRKEKNFKDYDLIIVTSSIVCHETEIKQIEEILKYNKKVIVIGPFASSNPNRFLKTGAKVLKGEPEMFFHNLTMDSNFFDKLPNLIENNKLHDLDELSFPAWETIFKDYIPKMKFLGKGPAITIYASKGCPYQCFYYCVYPLQQGRKVRARSVENIIDEIKYWKKELGTNKFVFRDPVFSINRKHTIAFCKKVIEEKLDITFMVETHLNNLDDEMIPLLRKAGLELVYVGVESSSHYVLKDMKRFTVEHDKQFQVIKKCEDAGIKVKTMFIIGNPEDSKDTIIQSIEYAKYLPSLYSQFSVFTPYPGTPAYNDFKDIITENKLENFNQYNLTFKHKNLTKKNISDLKSLAYFRFYFNLKKMFQILKYFLKSKYEKKNKWVG